MSVDESNVTGDREVGVPCSPGAVTAQHKHRYPHSSTAEDCPNEGGSQGSEVSSRLSLYTGANLDVRQTPRPKTPPPLPRHRGSPSHMTSAHERTPTGRPWFGCEGAILQVPTGTHWRSARCRATRPVLGVNAVGSVRPSLSPKAFPSFYLR